MSSRYCPHATIPLDYIVSDSTAMLTRHLVPTVDMRILRLKSHHICNAIYHNVVFIHIDI